LRALRPTFYTGNCHKWLCAPKGAGFLYVDPEFHNNIRPLSISHGANSPRKDRSRLELEFSWTGTSDPTAFLSVPGAIELLGKQLEGGWLAWMERNRALAVAARQQICEALELPLPAPEAMIGSMASIPLPAAIQAPTVYGFDSLQEALWTAHRIEVPVMYWPAFPARLLRISAQAYNKQEDYQRLLSALHVELPRHRI
jgi:isopenicillin-N epimerase